MMTSDIVAKSRCTRRNGAGNRADPPDTFGCLFQIEGAMIRLSAAAGRNWLCTSRADCSSADRVLEYRSNQAIFVSRKTSVQRSAGSSWEILARSAPQVSKPTAEGVVFGELRTQRRVTHRSFS